MQAGFGWALRLSRPVDRLGCRLPQRLLRHRRRHPVVPCDARHDAVHPRPRHAGDLHQPDLDLQHNLQQPVRLGQTSGHPVAVDLVGRHRPHRPCRPRYTTSAARCCDRRQTGWQRPIRASRPTASSSSSSCSPVQPRPCRHALLRHDARRRATISAKVRNSRSLPRSSSAGTSLFGGRATIIGTFTGALMIAPSTTVSSSVGLDVSER